MPESAPENPGDKYEERIRAVGSRIIDVVSDRYTRLRGLASEIKKYKPFEAGDMPDKDKD